MEAVTAVSKELQEVPGRLKVARNGSTDTYALQWPPADLHLAAMLGLFDLQPFPTATRCLPQLPDDLAPTPPVPIPSIPPNEWDFSSFLVPEGPLCRGGEALIWMGGQVYINRLRKIQRRRTTIKILRPEIYPDPQERLEAFSWEASCFAFLSRWGISPELYGIGRAFGCHDALVMEQFDASLFTFSRMAKSHPDLWKKTLGNVGFIAAFIFQILHLALGIQRRFQNKTVFGDYKPSNFLIKLPPFHPLSLKDFYLPSMSFYEKLKKMISHFSLGAKNLPLVKLTDFNGLTHVGRHSQRTMTPNYSPPEVLIALAAGNTEVERDLPDDPFAIATVLFELLTGDYLFSPSTLPSCQRTIDEMRSPKRPSLCGTLANKGLPPRHVAHYRDFDPIIQKATSPEKDHRYASMEAMVRDAREKVPFLRNRWTKLETLFPHLVA